MLMDGCMVEHGVFDGAIQYIPLIFTLIWDTCHNLSEWCFKLDQALKGISCPWFGQP